MLIYDLHRFILQASRFTEVSEPLGCTHQPPGSYTYASIYLSFQVLKHLLPTNLFAIPCRHSISYMGFFTSLNFHELFWIREIYFVKCCRDCRYKFALVMNYTLHVKSITNGPYSLLVCASYFYFVFCTCSICFRTIY